MTQDEYEIGSLEDAEKFAIIRMAREAGLKYDEPPFQTNFIGTPEQLERFAALVAQNYMAKACGGCVIKQCYKQMDAEIEAAALAEREACAHIAGEVYWDDTIAEAIRARGVNK